MKKIVTISIILATMLGCNEKKDDNFAELLGLALLSQRSTSSFSNTATVSLKANEPVAQQVSLTAGQEFSYTVRNSADTTSNLLSKNTAAEAVITISLIRLENGDVIGQVSSLKGRSISLRITPLVSGTYIVRFVSTAEITALTEAQGGSLQSAVVPPNQIPALADSPTKDIAVLALPCGNINYWGFYKVTVSGSTATATAINDMQTMQIVINGTTYNGTYVNNKAITCPFSQNFNGYEFTGLPLSLAAGSTYRYIAKKNSDSIDIDETLIIPNLITNLKVNNLSDNATFKYSESNTISWDNPSEHKASNYLGFIGGMSFNFSSTTQVQLVGSGSSVSYTLPANSISASNVSTANECLALPFAVIRRSLPKFYNGFAPAELGNAFESQLFSTNAGNTADRFFCKAGTATGSGNAPIGYKTITFSN
jgi:uncharacterized lipoprotein NlpE involved in copper resistance